jgi:hypothetical protein
MKTGDPGVGPIDQIMALAREIIDECPSCAGKASEIALWAGQIRERRPGREELAALVDSACEQLAAEQKERLIEGLRALVRFAE